MKTTRAVLLSALFLVTALAGVSQAGTTPIVSAANAFLSTLDDGQRKAVVFPFDDKKQRARWSNLPTRFVSRAGLSLKSLSEGQRAAALALLQSALSPRGFEKVQQIMDADEVLKTSERNKPMFGKDLYYLSFLGTPSPTARWMLQFGGHHLALNLTVAGDRGILTPSLTGAQPALFIANGKTVRPLGAESDKAVALLNALTAEQRKSAVLTYKVGDLVLGPGQDGKVIQPEGLRASEMTAAQRSLLLDLIAEWAGIVNESAASERMAEIKSGLPETWFAWSGATTATAGQNITAYYRIQGPKLVIEYSPQRLGGDMAMHVHAMYRDPTNDYGRALATP